MGIPAGQNGGAVLISEIVGITNWIVCGIETYNILI